MTAMDDNTAMILNDEDREAGPYNKTPHLKRVG
jgi:hypothetical protein